jgi:ribonuclease E
VTPASPEAAPKGGLIDRIVGWFRKPDTTPAKAATTAPTPAARPARNETAREPRPPRDAGERPRNEGRSPQSTDKRRGNERQTGERNNEARQQEPRNVNRNGERQKAERNPAQRPQTERNESERSAPVENEQAAVTARAPRTPKPPRNRNEQERRPREPRKPVETETEQTVEALATSTPATEGENSQPVAERTGESRGGRNRNERARRERRENEAPALDPAADTPADAKPAEASPTLSAPEPEARPVVAVGAPAHEAAEASPAEGRARPEEVLATLTTGAQASLELVETHPGDTASLQDTPEGSSPQRRRRRRPQARQQAESAVELQMVETADVPAVASPASEPLPVRTHGPGRRRRVSPQAAANEPLIQVETQNEA